MTAARRSRSGPAPGVGLAFLDVLCCGLGSAVFLLLIIQRGPAPVETDDPLVAAGTVRAEAALEAVTGRLGDIEVALAMTVADIQARLAALRDAAGARRAGEEQARAALVALRAEQDKLAASGAELRGALETPLPEPPQPPAPPREHLTGLRINEDRVAVFLDASASMLDRSLIEILRLRASPDRFKQAAPKWTVARNTAKWAYRRIPDGGRYRLLAYSTEVRDVYGAPVPATGKLAWKEKMSVGPVANTPSVVEAGVDALLPEGPTNLRGVFEAAARLDPLPTQVLLITDGLPTMRGDASVHRLRGCGRRRGNAVPLLTPECRASVFRDARAVAARKLSGTRIDVVLLPLEGDSNASGTYWDLALATGGRLLTPAEGWPPP